MGRVDSMLPGVRGRRGRPLPASARCSRDRALRRALLAVGLIAGTMVAAVSPAAAQLPDGRGFERVSRQDTNGLSPSVGFEALADNGDVLFGGGFTPTGPSTSGEDPYYVAHRTPAGWVDDQVSPPAPDPYSYWNVLNATRDLSAIVFASVPVSIGTVPPDQDKPSRVVYRDGQGRVTTIVDDADASNSAHHVTIVGGMSADGQTVVYSSGVTPPGQTSTGGLREVYAWHPGTTVSRLPTGDELDGTPVPADCGAEVAGIGDGDASNVYSGATTNSVSQDASTTFTYSGQAGPDCPPSQIYAIHDGSAELASGPSTSSTAPSQPTALTDPATFWGAAPDGRTMYFTTSNRLTSQVAAGDGGVNLYRWTAAGDGRPAAVTCLSCEATGSANVTGVAVSASGRYVYFQARGVIDGAGTPNAQSTFVLDGDGDGLSVVGTTIDAPASPPAFAASSFVLDDDGGVAVFSGPSGATHTALYRSQVGAGGVQVTCLSCDTGGQPQEATFSNETQAGFSGPQRSMATLAGDSPVISADGTVVVFTSAAALTPNAAQDVNQAYRWRAGQGVALLGSTIIHQSEVEVSPDATDIVFQSPAALTPDTTQRDVLTMYDARIGGGFAAPTMPPSCTGDGCQGPASPAVPSPVVGSSGPTAGNPAPVRPALGAPSRPPTAALRRLLAGHALAVSIRAHGGGTLRVDVIARAGRRSVVLATGRARTTVQGGRVRVRVRPRRSALERLRRLSPTAVVIVATLPGARTRTSTVRFARGAAR